MLTDCGEVKSVTTFEIRVRSLREVLEDFSRVYKGLAAGERIEASSGVYFSSLEAARNLLTPERVRLLTLIHQHHPQSIYELAELAGRDLKNIYEDVALLERPGILKKKRRKGDDRSTFAPMVPYDEIRLNIPLRGVAEAETDASYDAGTGTDRREQARLRYKPTRVRYLFIAESPPLAEGRFFYFEDVTKADNLFLETMRVVYPPYFTSVPVVRKAKREFLRRWQADGFYLMDAVDEPLGPLSQREKREVIRNRMPAISKKVADVVENDTRIILISAPVHRVCYRPLLDRGFKVVNDEPIDFPGQGRQRHFRQKLQRALREAGWVIEA